MKIVEFYAKQWLIKNNKDKAAEETVLEFAREIEKMMGITEEAKDEKK